MKPFLSLSGCTARVSRLAFGASLSFAALGLIGCGGMASIPDTPLPGSSVQPGTIHGSVFGGHAPIIGAHVYVMQAGNTTSGTAGYAQAAKSLITTGTTTSDTHGKYVVTDSNGAFDVTGDYACTTGLPVYLVAAGGQTADNIGGPGYSVSPVIITAASAVATGSGYTLTFTSNNLLYPNEGIVFNTLSVAPPTSVGWNTLIGGVYYVTNPTGDTSFTLTQPAGTVFSGTTTGTATPQSIANPAIANMAVLGNCPDNLTATTGNFSSGSTAISYVYMNEVSTAAAAYALAGFGSGPFNVGYPAGDALALTGIENAATNAGQLYDIEGKYLTDSFAGEGHIASPTTPAGNGVVPQSTLDTIGNILASCVDSNNYGNSATNPDMGGSGTPPSTSCSKLFTFATGNGIPYGTTGSGTIATDTATAAFNIAHYPSGSASASPSTFTDALFALQGSETPPFGPFLASPPNDFTVAIKYAAQTDMGNPESIAVDGAGNIFYTNQSTGYVTKMLPTGAIADNYATGVTPGYLSVDPSGQVWYGPITSGNSVVELTNALAFKAKTAPSYATVSAAATDSAGDFYFISATPALDVDELTSTLANAAHSPFSGSNTCIPSGVTYDHLAIDGTQSLWVTDEHGGKICRFTTTGAVNTGYPITTATGAFPEQIGIDASGNAWVTLETANEVDHITNVLSGTLTTSTLTSASTGATFNAPFSATVDGAGNVWVTIRNGNSIAELSNSGTAISPTNNYQYGTGILSDPLNAAIDGSGDVWITNYNGDEIVELIGAAAPTVTPLSYASGHSGLGAKP